MPEMMIQQAMDLAIGHHRSGRLAEAESLYRQVLTYVPRHAEALHRLGILAFQTENYPVAIRLIKNAIAIDPTNPEFYCNLGLALFSEHIFDEAVANLETSLRLNPNSADAHFNLGNALGQLGKLDEAIASYQSALRLNPDLPGAHHNLASALKSQGLLDESLKHGRRAIELMPGNSFSHSNLLYALHFHPDYDAATIHREHRIWNERYAAPLKHPIPPHDNDRTPDRRLRIGYVSPDFREHVIARFLLPILENRDRTAFEIFCYSGVPRPDEMTQRVRELSDQWRETQNLSDEQAAQMIRQDRIDLLIDLSMHMSGNRMLLFARKPAPVQITYLAYCSTTGLDAMDYRITDPHVEPPGVGDDCYSERPLCLPETYWCYQPTFGDIEILPPPSRQAGYITFGCLNNFAKVSVRCLQTWSKILATVPQSQLILHAHEGSHRQRVRELITSRGIESSRVRFVGQMAMRDYFNLYQSIDIALDPFPYNGGTTTCDSLWMGVPVVSLAGRTGVSRAGLSILSNAGLSELVADDTDDYARITVKLAGDPLRVSELRSGMRRRMQASPLMDAPRFTRNLEALYRKAWTQWCVT